MVLHDPCSPHVIMRDLDQASLAARAEGVGGWFGARNSAKLGSGQGQLLDHYQPAVEPDCANSLNLWLLVTAAIESDQTSLGKMNNLGRVIPW